MLNVCEKYALENNLRFSTHVEESKSKCKALHVTGQKSIVDPPVPLKLFGEVLPWVLSCDHNLNISGTMDGDCRRKRAEFIDKSVNTRELFHFAHPHEIVLATQKFCSDF